MSLIKDAKFRDKFLLAFSIPLSLFVITAIFAIVTINRVESSFAKLTEGPNQRIVYASDAVAEFAFCRRSVLAMAYESGSIESIKQFYAEYQQRFAAIIEYLDDYYDNFMQDEFLSDQEKAERATLITDLKHSFSGSYNQNVESLYKAALAQDRPAMELIAADGIPLGMELTRKFDGLRTMVQQHVQEITESTRVSARNATTFMLVLALALVGVSLLVSIYMASELRRPIDTMGSAMAEIAKGNLSYPIRSGRKDELGILAEQIGTMVDTISMLNKAVVIVDTVDELIFVTDLQFTIIFINQKVEDLYGIDKESCLGRKCFEVMHGEAEPCSHCPLPRLMADSENLPSCEWEQKFPIKGEEMWFSCKSSIKRWVDGTLVQVFTCKDDTLRKKHDEQRLHHAEELRRAAIAAESASRAKSTFLANMSHEIRTPMNAVMGMSELILRQELPPGVYEHALTIKTASQNLLSIINDILDFSKIESGMMELTEADYQLSSLVSDIVGIIRVRIIDKSLLFSVNIDSRIPENLIGDEVRIRQIFLNLLGNAVKYTAEGHVSLTIKGQLEPGEVLLKVYIEDSGAGIRQEDIDSLFDDFVQLDNDKNADIEGTGLGLPIALRLCNAMGGDIEVDSEYGKGSSFTITLPQKYTDSRPFALVEQAADKHVLLYEPRPVYRESLQKTLRDLGVKFTLAEQESDLFGDLQQYSHVFAALSGHDALKKALAEQACTPQIVLLTEITEVTEQGPCKSMRTLLLPTYSLPIANVLNDVKEERDGMSASKGSFTAPDARVLIVDDMASNLLVAKGLMASYDMEIDTCLGGAAAVQIVSENYYDVIFMDHMMPKVDGLEATRRIRELEGEYFQNVPIIALTANAIAGVREMFIQHGMNDFLAKPIETAKLDAMLAKWLPIAKQRREKTERGGAKANVPASEGIKAAAAKADGGSEAATTADSSPDTALALRDMLRAVPGLSCDNAIATMGGSLTTYEEIFGLSIRLLPDDIAELEQCLLAGAKDYEIKVHGIKGVLNNIGAYELGRSAYELEDLAQQGEMEECGRRHPAFVAQLWALLENVRAILEGLEPAPDLSPGDVELLARDLPLLEEAIEFFNATQALEILAATYQHTYTPQLDSLLTDLRRALESFEYDEGLEILEKLKGELE